MVEVEVAKNIEGCFLQNLLSYLACSQIWLNLPVDHCHFGYNSALPKKNTAAASIVKSRNKSGEISSWEMGCFFFFFFVNFNFVM
jgi:hypothetical protein